MLCSTQLTLLLRLLPRSSASLLVFHLSNKPFFCLLLNEVWVRAWPSSGLDRNSTSPFHETVSDPWEDRPPTGLRLPCLFLVYSQGRVIIRGNHAAEDPLLRLDFHGVGGSPVDVEGRPKGRSGVIAGRAGPHP